MHITHQTIQRLFNIKNSLYEVYWNLVIQTFASSLIGIFIPIYLLTIGLDIHGVLVFCFFYYGTMWIASPFSGALTAKVGYKHQILYHLPIVVFFYSLLLMMQIFPLQLPLLYLTAVLGGLSSTFYWVPLNAEFVKNTRVIHQGEDVATIIALPKLITIAAPTAAGILLTFLGFDVLFIVVLLLMFFSVVPLFATHDYRSRFSLSRETNILNLDKKLSLQILLSGLLLFMEFFIWPLFLYIKDFTFLEIGFSASLASLGVVFFTLAIGRLTDRKHTFGLLKIGGLAYGCIWITRLFSSTDMEFFLLSLLGGMFISVIEVAVFSSFCNAARGKRILNWIVMREVWLSIGRLMMVIILLVASWSEFSTAFVIAAIAGFLFLVV